MTLSEATSAMKGRFHIDIVSTGHLVLPIFKYVSGQSSELKPSMIKMWCPRWPQDCILMPKPKFPIGIASPAVRLFFL